MQYSFKKSIIKNNNNSYDFVLFLPKYKNNITYKIYNSKNILQTGFFDNYKIKKKINIIIDKLETIFLIINIDNQDFFELINLKSFYNNFLENIKINFKKKNNNCTNNNKLFNVLENINDKNKFFYNINNNEFDYFKDDDDDDNDDEDDDDEDDDDDDQNINVDDDDDDDEDEDDNDEDDNDEDDNDEDDNDENGNDDEDINLYQDNKNNIIINKNNNDNNNDNDNN